MFAWHQQGCDMWICEDDGNLTFEEAKKALIDHHKKMIQNHKEEVSRLKTVSSYEEYKKKK